MPAIIMAATAEVRGVAARICAVSGALSYPIYVLHAPFMIQAKKFFPGLIEHAGIGSIWLELAFVLAMALLALAADRWLDRPVRRWLADRVPGR
jgi:peptidoglycan/LPS O-acetylase OafA/YrhL